MRFSRVEPRTGLLVVLSGPSGVGKGTVIAQATALDQNGANRLRPSVSVTTRQKRLDEREGEGYFFRTPAQFEKMRESGALLEWAVYLDHCYGTPAEWVQEQRDARYDVILEIEVQGAIQVKERCPDAVLIYLLPPSWEELRRRLRGRRSESEELQERRLAVAREEVRFIPQYHYAIVNDDAVEAAKRFLCVLTAERSRVTRATLSYWLEDSGE